MSSDAPEDINSLEAAGKKKKKNALHKDSAQVSIENVGPVIDGFITAPTV